MSTHNTNSQGQNHAQTPTNKGATASIASLESSNILDLISAFARFEGVAKKDIGALFIPLSVMVVLVNSLIVLIEIYTAIEDPSSITPWFWGRLIILFLAIAVGSFAALRPRFGDGMLAFIIMAVVAVGVLRALVYNYIVYAEPLIAVAAIISTARWGTRAGVGLVTTVHILFILAINTFWLFQGNLPDAGLSEVSQTFGQNVLPGLVQKHNYASLLFGWGWNMLIIMCSAGVLTTVNAYKIDAAAKLKRSREQLEVQDWLVQSIQTAHGEKVLAIGTLGEEPMTEEVYARLQELTDQLLVTFGDMHDEKTAGAEYVTSNDPAAAEDSAESERPLSNFSVLLVDDDLTALRASKLLLQSLGAEVTTANNGIGALVTLSRAHHFDAIFSDIVMPQLDGLGLAKILSERPDAPPVALLTSSITQEEFKRIGTQRVLATFPKPLSRSRAIALKKLALTHRQKKNNHSVELQSPQAEDKP